MTRTAIVTGITGQDGSYLSEFLLEKGYKVHGIVRRVAMEDPEHRLHRLKHLPELVLHSGSLESYSSLFNILRAVMPDECYHLGAQSFVSYSFEDAFSTINANIGGTLRLLSAVKEICPECKFYFAGSSEMFGKVRETPQNEDTPFYPRSPYGISKVAGFDLTRNYREAYNLFACNGILFNHESPRRGFEFVTRKITSSVAKIYMNKQKSLKLGNLDAKRDWGFAGDYVEAMWMMLQHYEPDDYVIATGEEYSVKEFARMAFEVVDLDWNKYVEVDDRFFRPAEVTTLKGDASKAERILGWKHKTNLQQLVKMMVESDLDCCR